MADLGKTIILVGGAIVLVGIAVLIAGKLGFRGMPGDINYQSEHVRFYFPVVTCILISVVLSLAMWIYRWLSGR